MHSTQSDAELMNIGCICKKISKETNTRKLGQVKKENEEETEDVLENLLCRKRRSRKEA